MLIEEDDIFRDVLLEFIFVLDYIQIYNSDYLEIDFFEVLVFNQDYVKGRGFFLEIFYEVFGSDNFDFVLVIFMIKDFIFLEYDGIDIQVLFFVDSYY